MKTNGIWLKQLGAWAAMGWMACSLQAADEHVTGKLEVDDTLSVGGNSFDFGTTGGSDSALLWHYNESGSVYNAALSATRDNVSYLWEQNAASTELKMKLDANNVLTLFAPGYASGNGGKIILTPGLSGSQITVDGNALLTQSAAAATYLTPSAANSAYLRKDASQISLGTSTATGPYSFAGGESSTASGEAAMAFGNVTQASGNVSFAVGEATIASGDAAAAFGGFSTASGVGSSSFGYFTTASGWYSAAFGAYSTASGDGSTAFGQGQALGIQSVAFANGTAQGDGSFAFGGSEGAFATGTESFASGSDAQASGNGSIALGSHVLAEGDLSVAVGYFTKASSFGSVALGAGNVGYRSSTGATQWNAADPLLEVGNGGDSGAASNAVTVLKDATFRSAGTGEFKGGVRLPPKGDLSMGEFTTGQNPAELDPTTGLRYPEN